MGDTSKLSPFGVEASPIPVGSPTAVADQATSVRASVAPVGTQKKDQFSTIRQGTATNALTKLRAVEGQTATIDPITGEATITNGNIILKIPNYEQLTGLKTSTYQLLDAITIALTESGAKDPSVVISLGDYMKRRGLKDRKDARKQFTADLEVLLKSSLSWEEKRGKETIPIKGINITDSWGWVDKKKTAVVYTFGSTFYRALLGYKVMPYPAQLQTVNNKRNPNSYYLLRKIAEHKNMNIGKKNEDYISVATLLDASPFFPTYAEVMAGNRNIADRIISPFERDMDALSDTLRWSYCHSKGEPLTDEEMQNFSYDLFSSLLVKTDWNNYPDQTARLARKAERIEQAKATKKKSSSKKKVKTAQ